MALHGKSRLTLTTHFGRKVGTKLVENNKSLTLSAPTQDPTGSIARSQTESTVEIRLKTTRSLTKPPGPAYPGSFGRGAVAWEGGYRREAGICFAWQDSQTMTPWMKKTYIIVDKNEKGQLGPFVRFLSTFLVAHDPINTFSQSWLPVLGTSICAKTSRFVVRLSNFGWTKEQVKDQVKQSLGKERIVKVVSNTSSGFDSERGWGTRDLFVLVSFVCQEGSIEESYWFGPKTRWQTK